MITKKELAVAQARFERGERWHDGPPLLIAELDGADMGIGTIEELDALKTDGILPEGTSYRPATPQDLVA
jgi:hypothetical protein